MNFGLGERFVELCTSGRIVFLQTILHHRDWRANKITIHYLPSKIEVGGEKYKRNPFLEPERELLIENLQFHRVIFNKFPVIPNHLLIISKEFIPQSLKLSEDDFTACKDALRLVANEDEWLFFYNSDTIAGASQAHRHLQLVHLPVVKCIFGENDLNGIGWYQMYSQLYNQFRTSESIKSYNLLFTTKWMAFIPRKSEFYHGVSFNSLAFVGNWLVKSEEEFEFFKSCDPQQLYDEILATTIL